MDDDYLEAVLDLVAQVPDGRVMTYGLVAEVLHEQLGRGGPRQVGQVMSRAGSDVPWWRVVRASGEPASCHEGRAVELLRAEGTPMTPSGRVVLRQAVWFPDEQVEAP